MEIYKATNKINGKIYIGQTTVGMEVRKQGHFRDVNRNNRNKTHFVNAIGKYGQDAFIFEVIDTATNINELDEKEIYWIDYYSSTDRDVGYNISKGGDNYSHQNETKIKIGQATKRDWNNPQVAAKMRKGLEKATQVWIKQCEDRRELVTCLYCGKQEYHPPHIAKSRKYCSIQCNNKDNQAKITQRATKVAKQKYNNRVVQARKLVDEWVQNDSSDHDVLLDMLKKEFNVKDDRTVIKYITNDKGTYKQLKEYISSVRD